MVSIDKFKKDAVDAFTAFTEVTYLYHNFNMFLTQIVMQDLGAYKKMTGNLHLLIAHGADFIR